jgi:hypothetical protein
MSSRPVQATKFVQDELRLYSVTFSEKNQKQKQNVIIKNAARCWWLTSVIPPTQEDHNSRPVGANSLGDLL